jgi:DNA-binding XRE family transcriptional regulator
MRDPTLDRKGNPYPRLALVGMARLGESVRRARHRTGLSQADLGRLCALDQSIISRLENGKLPSLRFWRLAQVIAALGPAWDPPPEPPRTVTVKFVDWSEP